MPPPRRIFVGRALALARRRSRWLLRRPRVALDRPPMFPGGLALDAEEEQAAIDAAREVVRSRRLSRYTLVSGNPLARGRTRELEQRFASLLGARHALAVNSGTSALLCGMAALGIGPGDEVIVPAYTWFSTATAVLLLGAVPIVTEVDDSLTLDPQDAQRRISPHTRAIVAVHMRGAPANLTQLEALAHERGLYLIEDAAQAAGASFHGRRVGTIGDVGAFSFEMSKTLTAGEGGMLLSRSAEMHRRAAMFHDSAAGPHLGISNAEWLPGLNFRMSELQAAVLLVQLDRLDGLLAAMRERRTMLTRLVADRLDSRGVLARTLHDGDGDSGLAFIFFLGDPEPVPKLVRALEDDNVPASRLYHDLAGLPGDVLDLHAYPAWTPLLAKRTWSAAGGPWRWHAREIEYAPDACPQTTDLLRRAVHVDISPALTPEHVRQMAESILRAIDRVL